MNRLARSAARWAAFFSFFLIVSSPAMAAASPQDAAGSPTGWIYRWLNFAIFFGAIFYVFYKKTPPFFRHRREAIGEAIAESTRAREEAERQSREAEKRLASLDQEVAELRERAKRESAGEMDRISALAAEEAKRIAQAGLLEIAAAERAAEIELRALTARMAVEQAEELLQKQMTPGTQSKLFEEFVTELAGSVN